MKRYFIWIALLNFIDMLFTAIGLSVKVIAEINPFMRFLWGIHPLMFIAFKTIFSLLAIYLAYFFQPKDTLIRYWKVVSALIIVGFIYIDGLHFYWFCLYLQQK